MKYSQYFIPTLKESPADADTPSAKLMIRAGLIRKVAAGLYEWLPFGLRTLKKVENIIREEMDLAGGLEVWLPHIQPKDLWEESGRWNYYGKELLRIKDRKNNEFCFAPTAEEIITALARNEIRSYKELPKTFYQFGTKFRDEIRPRFGIMRAREFYMKDAYSFHSDEKSLDATYDAMAKAYTAIFKRLGLTFQMVEADTGTIGGSSSHEFMVFAETGEAQMVVCDACHYAANVERAETVTVDSNHKETPLKIEEVATPGKHKVEDVAKFVKVGADKIIKTVFLIADSKPIVALLRGDTELNEPKIMRLLGAKQMRPATEDEYRSVSGSDVGFAGPFNLKAKVVADTFIPRVSNGVTGGGKKDVHLKNVNYDRDYKADIVGDIRNIRPGDSCPKCQKPVKFLRGIEVGHVFKLGTKYSEAMKATVLDEGGKAIPMIMGCYGIGVSRIVAAAIEQRHDDNGISWPVPMAPFEVIVSPTNVSNPDLLKAAQTIYKDLQKAGIDVLLDDRDERAGVKFKDADLIGIPFRITIGEKSLAKNVVELKKRNAPDISELSLASAAAEVIKMVISARNENR